VTEHTGDLQLVERMLGGDENAFAAFGDRYFAAVYRFALARLDGDRELTREIVQSVMTRTLSRLDTYRGEASLLTWLCACCRNEILMHFRRRSSAPAEVAFDGGFGRGRGGGPAREPEPAAGAPAAAPRAPDAALERRQTARLVHAALDALPARYARALEWKYLEHLPVREIAVRLEVGPKAAESLLTRARQAFRTTWEELDAAARGPALARREERDDARARTAS